MSETIGLDIGSHSIKLVGVKKTSKGPLFTGLGLKKIPQGIAKEDADALSILLKDLVEESGIKTKKVRLIVSGSGIQIRRMTMPFIPKKELHQALPWEMKQHLPFPVETAHIQYHILGEFVEEGAKKLDLLAVACPNNLIGQTLSIVNGAGLQASHLDVSAFALWNSLLAWNQLKIGETVALVDLGSEKTSLYLFKDEILQFSREMTPAANDLTRAIMDGIPFERDLIHLFEKAERLKEEIGILPETGWEKGIEEPADLPKISFLMRPVLERWGAEIGRSLDYYRNQFYGEKVDRLLLTGGGARLKHFASYLEGELKLPIKVFNPLENTLYDAKKMDIQAVGSMGSVFTAAAGVALSGPKRIEFLPARESFCHKPQSERRVLLTALLITGLLFAVIFYHTNNRLDALQKEHDEKMARVAKLEDLRSKLTLLKEKEMKIKRDLSLFPPSPAFSLPYRDILKEVSRVIPGNVTLTYLGFESQRLEIQSGAKSLKKSEPASKPGETGTKEEEEKILYLGGLAFGNDLHCLTALAQVIEGLERSSLFSNVKLVSTDEHKLYNQPATEFDVTCNIKPSPRQEKKKK